jgi:hypothetical protein
MIAQDPSPFVFIVTGAFALLTFVLAFYALVARERRTPYITTNTVYWTALSALTALLLVFAGRIISPARPTFEWLAQAALFVALLNVIWRVFALKNSHIYFRTDNAHKNLTPVRWLRSKWRSLRGRPSFEHASVDVPLQLLEDFERVDHFPAQEFQSLRDSRLLEITHRSLSIGSRQDDYRRATKLIADLALVALRRGCYLQYTTASRNPVELVRYLRTACAQEDSQLQWQTAAQRIIVIDAFTSHFGFTDTVHEEAAKEIEREGVVYVACPPSYAGIHTANAKAFNVLKAAASRGGRPMDRPAGLVVYEGTHALVDLESREQYRIFVRHVLASERLWRGMVTLVVEAAIAEDEWDLVKAYMDLRIDSSRN